MSSNAVKQRVPVTEKLIAKYGCGPVHFSGRDEALYERHLLFDSGVDVAAATARDRFEALARSVRDVLSQRWLLTEKTYVPFIRCQSKGRLLTLKLLRKRGFSRARKSNHQMESRHTYYSWSW